MQNPRTLGYFGELADRFSGWLAPVTWARSADPAPGLHSCYAVLAAVHLVVAFLLPTGAVYIIEQWRRAQFLRGFVDAGRRDGLLAQDVAEELGLPVQEMIEACLFDPVSAWVRFAALLPPLAACVWLVTLQAAEGRLGALGAA